MLEPTSAIVELERGKAELEAVLASGIFAKAPSLALLLEYVCAKLFEGHAHQIKEYNIAVEALGRPATFDPKHDSIVRVEAFRLRKRLKQFYENEGSDHPLRIVIPAGQYVPQFQERAPAESFESPETSGDGGDVGHSLALLSELNGQAGTAMDSRPQEGPARPASRFPWLIAAAIALPLLLVTVLAIRARSPRPIVKAASALRTMSPPFGAESDEVRIMAGSPVRRYVDHTGNIWSGDQFFHGGTVFDTPYRPILGTPDPEMYRFRREGDFSYDVPLRPGPYELHLYFAETLFGENSTAGGGEASRVFRVLINGKLAIAAFDVISDAGGNNTADEKVFKDVSPAPDGILHVQFARLVNNVPFLNGIEILPGIPGKMRPVRIAARTRNYTDQRGRVWLADRYYIHGNVVTRNDAVSDTPDPELFRAERFGHFVYSIPAAEGSYAVTVKFAETWFGPGKPGGGGVGSRIFDLYSNGVALLRNFDIFRAADGPERAIERTFHGIRPNAQGKIVLSFVPVVNYACINAIEVVDDSE